MRLSASWFGCPGPTGYKVVARLIRARKAGSPLIVIPTALSVPSCSKLSRYGLARAEYAANLGEVKRLRSRANLSDPAAQFQGKELK